MLMSWRLRSVLFHPLSCFYVAKLWLAEADGERRVRYATDLARSNKETRIGCGTGSKKTREGLCGCDLRSERVTHDAKDREEGESIV